jgi:hypothetical protein
MYSSVIYTRFVVESTFFTGDQCLCFSWVTLIYEFTSPELQIIFYFKEYLPPDFEIKGYFAV